MPATQIDLKDASEYINTVIGKAIREGAKRGLYSAALRMVSHIKATVIPSIVPEPSARGHYKAGWNAGHDSETAWYENTLPHAAFIEYGVRPANVKVGTALINGLVEWVSMKGLASGPAAVRLAWRIAHTMATSYSVTSKGVQRTRTGGGKGIFGQGLRVMEIANEDLEQFVEEEIAREIERALR